MLKSRGEKNCNSVKIPIITSMFKMCVIFVVIGKCIFLSFVMLIFNVCNAYNVCNIAKLSPSQPANPQLGAEIALIN